MHLKLTRSYYLNALYVVRELNKAIPVHFK